MKPIQIISQDIFDKIRSRFSNLEMGDETGAVTIDPAESRFFDFDFIHEGNKLGRVSISVNDPGSLKLYYSQGITENLDDDVKKYWFSFLKEMRLFAMRRLLRFDTRDIAKDNLDRNDFQYLANKQTSKDEENMKQMNESRWTQKSSRKTSRAVKGATEVIVRHHKPVDEMYPGARSQRKNIKAIFIQNRDGERFKYPFIHPAGAFAMAQHVDHGGVPHDPAGKAIMRMSEQIAQLQEFQRKVQHSQLHDDALGITERAVNKLHSLKSTIEALSKRHHYESWITEFENDPIDDGLSELDPVTMEDYKSKFTETNFKEELAGYFPLLHSIMRETNAIDLEDYVKEAEEETCDSCDKPVSKCKCDDHVKETFFNEFEQWAEAVEQGKLTDDQVEALKNAIETEIAGDSVPLGDDGQSAWDFFSGAISLDDNSPEFSDDLRQTFADAAKVDPETDGMEVFQVWASKNYPELAVALGMSEKDSTTEPADSETPPESEPTALETTPEPQTSENDDIAPPNTMMPKESSKEDMIKEVAKIVKSFYNRDNPTVGPFRGGEGIALDVEKKISEKFGESAGSLARKMAEAFMEKLTTQWEEKHSKKVGVADDGLARLKELVGTIKTKVEGIGDQGESGEDFNKNIMPAEDQAFEDILRLSGLKK